VAYRAVLALVLAPIVVSIAGVVAILLGYHTIGIGLVVAGLVIRAALYLGRRWLDRFANRKATPSP
jgi:hypothetical protein